MELINNTTKTLKDDLSVEIKQGSKLSIAAACFSIYAFQELKEQLSQIEELRFIFIRSLELGVWNEELSLDENLTLHTEQENLKKQIEKMEKQARAEKQPKKKFELVRQIKRLKKN